MKIEWIYTKDTKPLAYKTGHWDGRNSDQVVAEDKNGKKYLAVFNEGFMDGSSFEDWYDERDYLIDVEIVKYHDILL